MIRKASKFKYLESKPGPYHTPSKTSKQAGKGQIQLFVSYVTF